MTIEVDEYVFETLMPDLIGHDRRPSSFIVYLALWHRSAESRDRSVAASLRELAEWTGISKRAVQGAVAKLARRKLIGVDRATATAIPVYTVFRPWVRKR